MIQYFEEEGFGFLDGMRVYKVAVIEPKARPEVVHQDGEASHNGQDAPRTTKLITRRDVLDKFGDDEL